MDHCCLTGLQLLDHRPDLLDPVVGTNEERVLGIHHHQVLEPDGCGRAPAAVDKRIFAAQVEDRGTQGVTAIILGRQAMDRGPLAEIRPADVRRYYH